MYAYFGIKINIGFYKILKDMRVLIVDIKGNDCS